jgi:hypothetical protein
MWVTVSCWTSTAASPRLTPLARAQAKAKGTFPGDINPAGAIVVSFVDASNAYHGFLLEGE